MPVKKITIANKQKKILLVEDEVEIVKVLTDKLTKEGFKVIIALNGKEGLKKALKEKPDLILLDIIMPVMNGMTMLEKLRTDKWGKKVDVIFLTNLGYADKEKEALDKGVKDYLIKSNWSLEDIIVKIKRCLKQ